MKIYPLTIHTLCDGHGNGNGDEGEGRRRRKFLEGLPVEGRYSIFAFGDAIK